MSGNNKQIQLNNITMYLHNIIIIHKRIDKCSVQCTPVSATVSKTVKMYYGSGSGAGGRCCICTWQMLCMHSADDSTFVWNDIMAAILKLRLCIRNPIKSINMYWLEGQLCQISSRSDLKQCSLMLFWRDHAQQQEEHQQEQQDQ